MAKETRGKIANVNVLQLGMLYKDNFQQLIQILIFDMLCDAIFIE